jgi:hypothetical protein
VEREGLLIEAEEKELEKSRRGRLRPTGSCGHEVFGKKMDLFLMMISYQYLSCQ